MTRFTRFSVKFINDVRSIVSSIPLEHREFRIVQFPKLTIAKDLCQSDRSNRHQRRTTASWRIPATSAKSTIRHLVTIWWTTGSNRSQTVPARHRPQCRPTQAVSRPQKNQRHRRMIESRPPGELGVLRCRSMRSARCSHRLSPAKDASVLRPFSRWQVSSNCYVATPRLIDMYCVIPRIIATIKKPGPKTLGVRNSHQTAASRMHEIATWLWNHSLQ